mgnify:FL=1
MNKNCVFCRIVAGGSPADKEYEDHEMVVFPDIHPSAPVHLLFVSKKHGEEFHNVEPEKLLRMLTKVRERIGELNSPYRVVMNGAGATVVQNHLHVHLLGQVKHDRPV